MALAQNTLRTSRRSGRLWMSVDMASTHHTTKAIVVSAGRGCFPAATEGFGSVWGDNSGGRGSLGVCGHECPDRRGPVLVEGGDVPAALDGPQLDGGAGRAAGGGLFDRLVAGHRPVEGELAGGGRQRPPAAVFSGPVADGLDGAGIGALRRG